MSHTIVQTFVIVLVCNNNKKRNCYKYFHACHIWSILCAMQTCLKLSILDALLSAFQVPRFGVATALPSSSLFTHPLPSSHASDITRRGQRLGSVHLHFPLIARTIAELRRSCNVALRLAHAPMQCCSTNNNNSEVTIMQCHNSKQLQQLLLSLTKCGCPFQIIFVWHDSKSLL